MKRVGRGLRRNFFGGLLLAWQAAAMAEDCDQNGVDDAAEIASGTASDCNRNGIPDACDIFNRRFRFREEEPLEVTHKPALIIAGDLNGDGSADLATAGLEQEEIWLHLRRQGSPSFSSEAVPVGKQPVSLASGDLDGDRDLDLAAANRLSKDITVLFNRGDGSFPEMETLVLGYEPISLAALELDGDGLLDLAAVSSNGVALFFNEGEGRFLPPIELPAGYWPRQAASADFNGDRLPDLAVTCLCKVPDEKGKVFLFLNRGGRTFGEPAVYEAGNAPQPLAPGDLNGDGFVDLAVGNSGLLAGPRSISIFFNLGDGKLAAPVSLDYDHGPESLAALDLDGDRDLDLASAIWRGHGLAVFLNDGRGAFAPPLKFRYLADYGIFAAADLDGDGDFDFAVAGGITPIVSILMNEPEANSQDCNLDGTPDECEIARDLSLDCDRSGALDACELAQGRSQDCNRNQVPDGCDLAWRTSADCDLDGVPDECELAAGAASDCNRNGVPDRCDVAPGLAFAAAEIWPAGENPSAAALADLDQDGDLDLAAAGYKDEKIALLANDGGGHFALRRRFWTGNSPRALAAADLDGDGRLDLAAASEHAGRISVHRNLGGLSFQAATSYKAGERPRSLANADLDGDADEDLGVTVQDRLTILYNDGSGAFPRRLDQGLGFFPYETLAADWDGDGLLDLAGAAGVVALMLNRGAAGFEVRRFENAFTQSDLAAADWDGDGDIDLAVAGTRFNAYSLFLLLNDGLGRLSTGAKLGLEAMVSRWLAADFDGDGNVDLVGTTHQSNLVRLFRNAGGGRLAPPALLPVGRAAGSMAPGDFDRDGDLDLAVSVFEGIAILINETRPGASPDTNRNGIPDECGDIVPFRRGYASDDGALDLSDAIRVLEYLFAGGAAPACAKAADANDDGSLDISDPIRIIAHLFKSHGPLPAPSERCGSDPTPDVLGCASFESCD